jgi:hypothetical protein
MWLRVHDGNKSVFVKKLRAALVVAGSLGLVGCCLLGEGCVWWGEELDDSLLSVPEGVAAVESDSAYFAQSPDHPLLDVPAGTVIEDLAGLEGCWGAYAGPDLLEGGAFVRVDAEFYSFDLDTMRMTYEVLQRGGWIYQFDGALEHVYELEIPAPDRITVRLVASAASTNLVSVQEVTGCMVVEDAEPLDLQITLDGDAFKFGDSEDASSDFSGPHRANLVFRRFDCPE